VRRDLEGRSLGRVDNGYACIAAHLGSDSSEAANRFVYPEARAAAARLEATTATATSIQAPR
jgi:hypothetical protein